MRFITVTQAPPEYLQTPRSGNKFYELWCHVHDFIMKVFHFRRRHDSDDYKLFLLYVVCYKSVIWFSLLPFNTLEMNTGPLAAHVYETRYVPDVITSHIMKLYLIMESIWDGTIGIRSQTFKETKECWVTGVCVNKLCIAGSFDNGIIDSEYEYW